ncbi:restriction endonuclease-like protein [Clostridium tagluense]|uniref:DUF2357 domain-containing protein n=1 Tax=Clostridium tagluense TaxID=360422 RepID=UPI001CF10131|nr:DUF2357 domain-containing protein [Clostridium tagluense]MCB2313470.1 restriction endonuclease-like protein [Clostridium tagluense]MCB2318263.1 restriction endonuclease-like protein [Clostridium tagluense]MCB2323065.1 restriction endonuclease-like protein [Clostridium tagluense]MCB2328047.1 restriction endonuclease-like protein [Clostridium tagluense]MCB2332797.1 restriction endonuclease-like protein [Clostridium tagluense]
MMGFQHSGSSTTLLYIETEDFKLYIIGKAENKKFNAINANINIEAHLCVDTCCERIIKTINESGELDINESNSMKPSFFEDGNYQLIVEKFNNDSINIYHSDKEIRESIIAIGNNYYGSFSFNGDIGHSKFSIRKSNKEILTLTVEVFPSKVDYLKDYKEILNEVNEEISSLVFDFLGKTFQQATLKDVSKQTGVEFTEILLGIYDKFEKVLNLIEKHPKHGVLNKENIKNIDKVKRVSRNSANYIRKHSNLLQQSDKGFIEINSNKYIPLKVIENKKVTTIDIYENQYVKYIIKTIIHRVRNIKENILRLYGIENNYYTSLNNFENRLIKHQNGFFKDISDLHGKRSMSLVFKMSFGYREIFYYYMMLKKGLDISEGLYNITPKKLWNLYEIWCYLKLHKLLKELGFTTLKNGIIEAKDNGITLSLTRNKESKITYCNSTGKNLELWYNKAYSHLPTTNQRPDTVLCLRNMDRSDRIYIFDAKYRLSVDGNNVIGPMEEDINVMHRYRDAIVSELDDSLQFKYNTFGAYVMFPYSNESEFIKHRYYKSIEKVNIGAFPMLPGSTSLIKNHLCKIVSESYIESTIKLPTYEVEDDYPRFKNTNVMIANISNKQHLEAYKQNNFFHIPSNKLSNVRLGVEYIAFYQSKNSFGDTSGIYYYAKIKEVRKYKRKDCSEIPVLRGNEEQDYLRFELEEIFSVGPIKTVEYGVELITYTTLYLLKNAETLHELHFKNRLEIELYKVLKEICVEKKTRIIRRTEYFLVGGVRIDILNGKKGRVEDEVVEWGEIRGRISYYLECKRDKNK